MAASFPLVLAVACRSGEAPAGADRPTPRAADPSPPTASLAHAPPTASPTPGPTLARLTAPGCCPLPFFSPDGESVLFWSGGSTGAEGQPGVYGVPIGGGEPTRRADVPLGIHRDGAFTTARDGDFVALRRAADGREWRFDTGGDGIVLSVDGKSAAWARSLGRSIPGERPPRLAHYLADLESGAVREVVVPEPYALSDWVDGGDWLLARRQQSAAVPAYVRFDPESGSTTPVLDARRPRIGRVSPDGRWLAVTRTFEDDPAANGLFVVAIGGGAPPRRIERYGAYRWRDAARLLVVPLEPGAPSMELWEVDARTGAERRLTDPSAEPFQIAAGEWSLSPDGSLMAFRGAADDAIWLLALP